MKRNFLQVLLGLALFGVVAQVILIAPRLVRENQMEPEPEAPSAKAEHDKVDQSLGEMHMIETKDGGKEWELWSDKADRMKDQDLIKLQHVRALIFSKSGVTFNVTGDNGTAKGKDLHVEGHTVTKSSNGYTFKSDHFDYNSEAKALSTDAPVEMLGPPEKNAAGLKLKGIGMKSLIEPGTMEILEKVGAEKSFMNGKIVYIHSHRALFNSHDRKARFLQDVVLDMESSRITGPEAQFDYDSVTDEVTTLTVVGGAKVSDTEKWATSDNLRVDFKDNKYTFWGRPRVVQNNDELRGEEIVFLDGGKEFQVHRARAKMDAKKMGKSD